MSKVRRAGRFAARRHVDAGPGSPIHIMTHHVSGLLRRLRTTAPFPLPVMEFLETCYPKEMFTGESSKDHVTRWDNLMLSTNLTRLAHFSVVGRDEQETFWVRLGEDEEAVPTPVDISKTLLLSKENPHFDAVTAWLGHALVLHGEIVAMQDVCKAFLRDATHPEHVARTWPDLAKFLGTVPDCGHVDPIQDTKYLRPHPQVRNAIITTLAKCVLLPETVCNAWVQFPEGD